MRIKGPELPRITIRFCPSKPLVYLLTVMRMRINIQTETHSYVTKHKAPLCCLYSCDLE